MSFRAIIIAAVWLFPALAGAQGLNYNASKSNTGNLVVSDGTNCTAVATSLDVNGNVTGTNSTVTTCSVPNGVYFVPTTAAQSVSPVATVIPQFVDGGSWQTTLGIINTTPSAATAFLSCYQETSAGDSSTAIWVPPFVQGSNTESISLAAGATLFLDTPGTAATLTEGWCQVSASDGVQVYSKFTWNYTNGGQGIAPAVASGSDILVPFDNTNGGQTGIALANTSSSSQTITVVFQVTGGAISQSTITLMPNGHKAFLFPTQFAASAGQRGIAEFIAKSSGSTQSPTKGVLSLIPIQFNSVDNFTTAQAYPVSNGPILSAPDPMQCIQTPSGPGCPNPLFLLVTVNANFAGAGGLAPSPFVINITPDSNGNYTASLSGTINGTPVSGSLSGKYLNPNTPWVFNIVVPGASTFNGGQIALTLSDVAIDASTGTGTAAVTGTMTLNQANVGSGQISGRCAYIYFPGLIGE